MRQLITALALGAIGALAAGCGTTNPGTPAPTTTSAPAPAPPVGVAGLDRLLLTDAEVNTAMGTTGMLVASGTIDTTDNSTSTSDKACLFAIGPVQDKVYAGTGWTAVRTQMATAPTNNDTLSPVVTEGLVLFPSAHDAAAFFTATAQSWPACSNRPFTFNELGEETWTMGQVSNTNGTLSGPITRQGGDGRTCQRALTVSNNVAIDIETCSANKNDPGAVNVAHQIAAKVPTQ
jgi:PknH-like extracellular domain